MTTPILVAMGLSGVLLLSANLMLRKRSGAKLAEGSFAVLVTLFVLLFVTTGGYFLPLVFQALALSLALPLASVRRRGPRLYLVASVGLTAGVWLYFLALIVGQLRQYDEWQQSAPFESMEQRVPIPAPGGSADGPLWDSLETATRPRWGGRADSLSDVHSDHVRLFHRAAGFGAVRMIRPNPKAEHFAPDLTPPVPQPERYDPNAVSLGEDVPNELRKPFGELHVNSLLDFTYPDGFGYVKNRGEVAGFRPHRFSKVPDPVEKWEVRRVELVGLLLHPSPAVYVSENLPRMQEVKTLPTREPDSFEAEGVKAIRTGEDLYTRGDDRDARMVGAIRSVGQCVECHGGQRGDLLGAFSYRLRRDAK